MGTCDHIKAILFWSSVLYFYAAYAGENMTGPVEKQLASLLLETVAGIGVPPIQLYIQINGRDTVWPRFQ